MRITVLKHNVPWGPFTRAQIDDGLTRGDFTLKYLAHAPGLREWLPLGEVLHFAEAGADLPPLPTPDGLPPVPGAGISMPPPPTVTIVPPPPLPVRPAPAAPLPPVAPLADPDLPTAPIFPRFIAFLVDCLLLFLPVVVFYGVSLSGIELSAWWSHSDAETVRQHRALLERNFRELFLLCALGLGWFYAAGLEASPWQGTIGKRWVGIKVTDMQGHRLGFLRATGRHGGKFLSALPCFLGFAAALFSRRRLAWHDRLAGTRVIRDR